MKNSVDPLSINEIVEKLKNTQLDQVELLGIMCHILYSKEVFPHNKDIIPFLEKIFKLRYLQYVLNSRTLIVAKITKHMLGFKGNQLDRIQNDLLQYITKVSNERSKVNKKKNANDKLSIWLKGL